jgi:hypothetical protein
MELHYPSAINLDTSTNSGKAFEESNALLLIADQTFKDVYASSFFPGQRPAVGSQEHQEIQTHKGPGPHTLAQCSA